MKSLALFLVIPLAAALGCVKEKGDEHSTIIFMIGEVTKNNAAAQIGDPVNERDMIQTGADSFCDIKIGGLPPREARCSSILLPAKNFKIQIKSIIDSTSLAPSTRSRIRIYSRPV